MNDAFCVPCARAHHTTRFIMIGIFIDRMTTRHVNVCVCEFVRADRDEWADEEGGWIFSITTVKMALKHKVTRKM